MANLEQTNLELDKTLQVDGVTYNINAKTAEVSDKVANKLIFKKTNLDGSESATSFVEYDGSAEKTLVIVPASGGGFTDRITVPDYTNKQLDTKAVLNCGDIQKFIVNELRNNSVLYTWDGTKLTVTGNDASIQSISIITGPDDKKDELAEKIYTTKELAAYIYISSDDGNRGNIYFGTCDSDVVSPVQVRADNAETANRLTTARNLNVLLSSTEAASFDGSASVQLGVTGVLSVANGGTGATSLSSITVGNATNATKAANATNATNATYATYATYDSDEKQINKNYYRSSASFGSVTNTITLSSSSPSGGNNGDIWIKY